MRFARNGFRQGFSNVSDRETLSEIIPYAYGELHYIAASLCRREQPDPMLEPLDLVHETYIRLAQQGPDSYINRAQFFCVAVCNMHRVLIDHIRFRRAKKRGGDCRKIPLETLQLAAPDAADVAAIDEAVVELKSGDPVLGHIAELRILGNLSAKEIARECGVAESTARKKWALARVQLQEKLDFPSVLASPEVLESVDSSIE
jgi:RNA polymerase sigma factor (TIGR02999 family)